MQCRCRGRHGRPRIAAIGASIPALPPRRIAENRISSSLFICTSSSPISLYSKSPSPADALGSSRAPRLSGQIGKVRQLGAVGLIMALLDVNGQGGEVVIRGISTISVSNRGVKVWGTPPAWPRAASSMAKFSDRVMRSAREITWAAPAGGQTCGFATQHQPAFEMRPSYRQVGVLGKQ